MNRFLIPIIPLVLICQPVLGEGAVELETREQRVSYSIGADIGGTLKEQGIPLDAAALSAGLKDALAGKTVMTDEEMRDAMTEFRQELMSKMESEQASASAGNLKSGQAFLASNGEKDGVVTLPSGLQYKVLKSGDGKSPSATDTVRTHYHGTLIDGTVFDSSVQRGEPVTFAVNQVIPGWTEALQLMKEGDKWELYIPANLAYGERGAGGVIGPNATLIFEVELLAVE